jgi:hypothetical protein
MNPDDDSFPNDKRPAVSRNRRRTRADDASLKPAGFPLESVQNSASPIGDPPGNAPPIASPVRLDELFPAYSRANYDAQAQLRSAQLIEEVRQAYLGEGLALYIGAGVSMSLGLPSWYELINSLTVAMMSRRVNSAAQALETLTDEERASALSALLNAVKEQPPSQKPILMLARALKDQFGDELPQQVAAHLYGRLSPTGEGFFGWIKSLFGSRESARAQRRIPAPADPTVARARVRDIPLPDSPLLDALVGLIRPQRNVVGVQAIINYNYDDILEEKLRQDSVPCLTMTSGKQKLTRGKIPSYHVHGVLPLRQYQGVSGSQKKIDNGNFVFSEDEYHSEYADPYRWSNLTQIGMLGRHKGLFVGLSMQDPNLRRLIDVTHRQYPEVWNYAILQRTNVSNDDSRSIILRNLAEYVEEDSFQKIGVKVIWVNDIKTDVSLVLNRIAALPAD